MSMLEPHEYPSQTKVLVVMGVIWTEIARLQLTPEEWTQVAAHFDEASKKPECWNNTATILAMVPR
jgi:hypothetical protein